MDFANDVNETNGVFFTWDGTNPHVTHIAFRKPTDGTMAFVAQFPRPAYQLAVKGVRSRKERTLSTRHVCGRARCFIVADYNMFLLLQLLPRMVMDIFESIPGIPGLFTASLFCAALRYETF